jgi:ribosomal protein S18 acetylase RimI-like enzyme
MMTANDLMIRRGERRDAPTIARFNVLMAQETESIELDPPTVERGVLALFDGASRGTYYVAERGGRVVGCLMITHEWSDWRNGDIWWIQSVYVDPEHRGAGVFKMMFEHVRTSAAGADVRAIRLYVEKHNARAKAVYAKLGMAMTGYDVMHMDLKQH